MGSCSPFAACVSPLARAAVSATQQNNARTGFRAGLVVSPALNCSKFSPVKILMHNLAMLRFTRCQLEKVNGNGKYVLVGYEYMIVESFGFRNSAKHC